MKIAMANDHAGTALKNQIKEWLEAQGHEVVDFGTYDEEGCDLSDFVYPAAQAVSKGECERGIFVDGVGYGSAMIANKLRGVFACVCQDPLCAELAREHNGPAVRGTRQRAQRRERAVHRRQDHRQRFGDAHRRSLDEHRPADRGEVCPPAR